VLKRQLVLVAVLTTLLYWFSTPSIPLDDDASLRLIRSPTALKNISLDIIQPEGDELIDWTKQPTSLLAPPHPSRRDRILYWLRQKKSAVFYLAPNGTSVIASIESLLKHFLYVFPYPVRFPCGRVMQGGGVL
jgi:hypothetical protein